MANTTLTISSKNYSSWSLRGWLLTKFSSLPFEEIVMPIDDPAARAELLLLSPSILVPCLFHDGIKIWDTLAIAEYLNELKPEAALLPKDVRAQDMCDKLRPYLKTHHVQTGVGHYGVFNGHRWERQIYPRVRAVIYDNEPRAVVVSSRARTIQPVSAAAASEAIASAPAAAAVVDVEVDSAPAVTATSNGVGSGSAAKTQQASRAPRRRPPATQS